MFLPRDTEQPDTVSQHLMRSGDIESNPGPPRNRASLRAEDKETGQQPGPTTCKGCRKKINRVTTPIICQQCEGRFHQKHSGETRDACQKIIKYDRKWTCGFCRLGVDHSTGSTNSGIAPGNCTATKCRSKKIRAGYDFLSCSNCKKQLHKQESCSGMTKQQVVNLDRTSWK